MLKFKAPLQIIFPINCKICSANHVPDNERTVLVFENEHFCGSCGACLRRGDVASPAITDVNSRQMIQTLPVLVRSGFAIDGKAPWRKPLRLVGRDRPAQEEIICLAEFRQLSSTAPEEIRGSRYERDAVDCVLPRCVRRACIGLDSLCSSNLDGSQSRPLLEFAQTTGPRKKLRFSWIERVDFDNGYRYNYEHVLVDIFWVQPRHAD